MTYPEKLIDFESGIAIGLPRGPLRIAKGDIWLSRGRDAIALICKHLLVGNSSAEILVPAFICEIVPETIRLHNAKVAYYDVGPQLQLDPALVQKHITANTAAILYVNYFGFAQSPESVQEICAMGFPVIEDNTQASLTGSILSEVKNAHGWSFTSFRKTLSVPDGAVLYAYGSCVNYNTESQLVPSFLHIGYRLAGLVCKYLALLFPFRLMNALTQEWFTAAERSRKYSAPAGLSILSKIMLTFAPVKAIIRKRQQNALFLIRELTQYNLLHQTVPAACCPFGLPLYTANRDVIREKLWASKINAAVLWNRLPMNDATPYPNAASIAAKILILPVGQGYTIKDMRRIGCALQDITDTRSDQINPIVQEPESE